MDTCFCPLQPAIVLAPINCTQTTAPQIEEPSTKPEPQTTDDQSEDSPQHPPQETPQAENEEEKKSDWKARQERHLSFHFMFYFVGTFFFFLHCVSVKDILSTYGRLFALGAKGRAERRSVFSERLAQRSTGIGHTHTQGRNWQNTLKYKTCTAAPTPSTTNIQPAPPVKGKIWNLHKLLNTKYSPKARSHQCLKLKTLSNRLL